MDTPAVGLLADFTVGRLTRCLTARRTTRRADPPRILGMGKLTGKMYAGERPFFRPVMFGGSAATPSAKREICRDLAKGGANPPLLAR